MTDHSDMDQELARFVTEHADRSNLRADPMEVARRTMSAEAPSALGAHRTVMGRCARCLAAQSLLAVVLGVIFALGELRHAERNRHDLAAVDIVRTVQTQEVRRAVQRVLKLPDDADPEMIRADPGLLEAALALDSACEMWGSLVFEGVVDHTCSTAWSEGGLEEAGRDSGAGCTLSARKTATRTSGNGGSGSMTAWPLIRIRASVRAPTSGTEGSYGGRRSCRELLVKRHD